MNILQFICSSGFYGAEMWILALAKNLDQAKVNCHLAITRESDEQNIEIYNRFQGLGLTAHQIKINSRFDPMAVVKLCKLIKRNNVDIIHTHGYKSDIIGIIAAGMSGIKTVATPHGFENAKDFKLQMFIRLGCIAFKYFDCVAPLSEDLYSDILGHKVRPDKIRLIVNGVDLTEVEAEKSENLPLLFPHSEEKKIGYVGQIAHRKNIGNMLDTFDLLYKKHKDIRLFLVGDGPMRKELEKRAMMLASGDKIEFLGYRKDRLRIIKEMDLFCMTSSLEGIPRCMMEAMAMGTPVAAFNIPGVDKLIIPEETGLMAEFGDVEGLKQCWERILFDEAFAKGLAKNGRQHILEHFSAKRMAEEYTELYREVLADSS